LFWHLIMGDPVAFTSWAWQPWRGQFRAKFQMDVADTWQIK
jgi:hypothetical protein